MRLPDDLADEVDVVARVHGTSVNQLIIDSLTVRDRTGSLRRGLKSRAERLLKRDVEILDRLAQ